MAVRTILQGDIPALRQQSQCVEQFDTSLYGWLDDLTDTLLAHRALGLSAPQIGIDARIFVADVGDGVHAFINPKIVESAGAVTGYESCLSFPEHTLAIVRPEMIVLCAQDEKGQPLRLEATGQLARVICHEVDHLDGILFMDHLSEDELFAQLFAHACVEEDDETQAEPSAMQEDLQAVVNMLADASWKLVLCLELLEGDETVSFERAEWTKLRQASQTIERFIEQIEARCTHPD